MTRHSGRFPPVQHKSNPLQNVPPVEDSTDALVMWGMSQPYQERVPMIIACLQERGVRLEDIVESSKVPRNLLTEKASVLPLDERLRLIETFARLAPTEPFAVETGRRLHLSSFGMLGYGLLCCETARDAWNMMQKYAQTTNTVSIPTWTEDGDCAYWQAAMPKNQCTDAANRFVAENTIGAIVTINHDLMGDEWWPLRASLTRARPSDPEAFEHLLGCPIEFEQDANRVYYDRAQLRQPLRMANSAIVQEVERSCEALLKIKAQTVTSRVCRELTRVPGHFPDIDAVANKMHMTSRTLRRRLSDEGTTFSTLRDETRLALARHYLRQGIVSTDDIAANVGFSDANSFRQAFKRWTGCSPSRYEA